MRTSLAVGGGLLLSACSSSPPLRSTAELAVVQGSELPAPTLTDLAAPASPYVIGPFDKLEIEVYGAEDLSMEVQADASGQISYPLAGDVEAAGMTPAQLAQTIKSRLAAGFMRDPQVIVTRKDSPNQVVTVDGEVSEPGVYPISGRTTLIQTLSRAKGATEFADLNHVVVMRTVDGQRMAALYDLRAIRSGIYADPQLYPQDVVMVGTSRARRIFKTIVEGAQLITTPLIVLLQR